MSFKEFTKKWKVCQPGASGEKKDHIIKIGGTSDNVTVLCADDDKHVYQAGAYVEGDPRDPDDPGYIERKAIPAYKITLDRVNKQITCDPSPVLDYGGAAGSWTANDNSGGIGGE
ncbi:MAG TPA: hypothetical protein VGS07_12280 [Thermoanaerobaculia bacterium]|jgi:hypothetical protein|nr:hypothetical protein [Thermoanaerobaculia bacterium]